MSSRNDWAWFRRVLAVLLLLGLAALVSQIIDVIFIAFGASLLAILLCWLTSFLQRQVPMRRSFALSVIIAILAVAFAASVWLFGTTLTAQLGQVAEALPESLRHIHQEMLQTDWGRLIDSQLHQQNLGAGNVVGRLTGIVGSAVGLLANFALIGIAGIYLAAEPELYRQGVLQLVPTTYVVRVEEVADAIGESLRLWIAGQLFAMVVVGIMWGVSLWALGVGSALALGVIAGLAEFVPVIGPILGAVPAVIIALAQNPALALWAVLVYLIIQQIESSLLMPLIQARVVSLPPTITLFAMVTCGLLFGILGVLFAMPLAVAMMVLVKMLYIEDVLGKRVRPPSL
jgi:predicted PurR-regulated permease PerM